MLLLKTISTTTAGSAAAVRLLLLALLCLALLPAGNAATQGQALDVARQASFGVVTRYQILEDPGGALTANDVMGRHSWQPGSAHALTLGLSRSAWWIRLSLVNSGTAGRNVVLDLGTPLQDFVDWHVLDRDSSANGTSVLSGDRRHFDLQFQPFDTLALPLALAPGQTVQVYARLSSLDGLHENMLLKLYSAADFQAEKSAERLLYGAFLGCLLSFCVYSLFIYFLIKEKIYIIYTAFLFAVIINSLTYYGIAAPFIFHDAPDIHNILLPSSLCLSMFFLFRYASSFLRIPEHFSKRLCGVHDAASTMLMLTSPLVLVVDYAIIQLWLAILGTFNIILLLAFTLVLCWRKNRNALFFFVAFFPLGLSLMLKLLGQWDVLTLPFLLETNFYLPQCTVFSVIALSFSLAHSMKTMRAAVEEAKSGELNSVIALQKSELKLLHLSRVTVAGELTGAIAHELSQPLTSVLSNAQAAELMMKNKHFDPAAHLAIVLDIVSQARRASAMLAKIRKMLLPGSKAASRIAASDILGSAASFLQHELDRQGIRLSTACQGELFIQGDVVQIQQVMINLIMNAIDAVRTLPGEHKLIHLSVSPCQGKYALFSVSDTGHGFRKNEHEQLFQAFFTTKTGGMGLGLTICKKIVDAHNGQIRARAGEPHGAIVEFTIPLHE